ncbi:MAG: hypothetical protein ACRDQ7_18625 [Haloechinothrix sp.]
MRPIGSDDPLHSRLGGLLRRFSHEDNAAPVLTDDMHVVTGFGPTNAPTAGSLSVMLGIIELQRRMQRPVTVVISELGAWNSRNVPWSRLVAVRDQMTAFLLELGFDTGSGEIRSHLDPGNLARAGKLARFLTRQDFLEHREELLELYGSHGLLGSEVGVTVDALYTVADILGPAEHGATRILMLSGLEEAYFTQLARIALQRQADAGDLTLGWRAQVGALYFRVLPGLAGYPKMSKSIPASAVHVGMSPDDLATKICTDQSNDQEALLEAISLASGWEPERIEAAHRAYAARGVEPDVWQSLKRDYLDTFLGFAKLWQQCG